MSKYKILYIDDEKNDLIIPIKNKLESRDKLSVDLLKPINFEKELERLTEILTSYHAVILDLQLDGPQEDGEDEALLQVKYQAPPLAQMIRTLATENKIPDLPIILCSTEDKIKDSYSKDFTSHNLFDWTFLKNDLNDETVDKICSFITGYELINANKNNYNEILKRNYEELDERILSRFVTEENPPNHEVARVIFRDVVQSTGILVDEYTLGARLGINIEQSKEDWSKLIDNYFGKARYLGAFSEGWNRWWSDIAIDIFEDITSENLASVNAEIRVVNLIDKTDCKGLIASKPIELNKSTEFWNVCEITKQPIDPFEGYKINEKAEPKPWQDYSYVSLYAILALPDKISKAGIKIHPSDLERLNIERKKAD